MFYDAEWATSSVRKGELLDREVYRLKPLGPQPKAGGAKRKYLRCGAFRKNVGPAARFETDARRDRRRYTEADDDALRAFVAARPALKATGLKIWEEAVAQKITEHSKWSMKERYALARAPPDATVRL